jgi:hypothetical protein
MSALLLNRPAAATKHESPLDRGESSGLWAVKNWHAPAARVV